MAKPLEDLRARRAEVISQIDKLEAELEENEKLLTKAADELLAEEESKVEVI